MNIKNMSIKDIAKEVYEERKCVNEVKMLLGEQKSRELVAELSKLFGEPVFDLDTPEGRKGFEEALRVQE